MTADEPLDLAELRERRRQHARDRCEWPRCMSYGEQLAHLEHRGMGGDPSANTFANVRWLCMFHHDIYDGRRHDGLKVAMRDCLLENADLKSYVGRLLSVPHAKEGKG